MKTITSAAPLTFSLWLFWLLVYFFSSPFLTLNHTQTLTATSIMYFPSKGLLFLLLLLLSHHILSGGLGFSSRTLKTRLSHYEIRCVNLSGWIRRFRKCTTLSNRNAFAKTINTAIKPAPFPTKKKETSYFIWGIFLFQPTSRKEYFIWERHTQTCMSHDGFGERWAVL